MISQEKNIEWVVTNGLCTSCGTCAAVCPCDAISMAETGGGLLLASVDADKCNFCGICSRICPGWHLEEGVLASDIDPFKGVVVSAYCGRATDKELLYGAQSGGVITALLCHLIESGYVDKAIVTQMPEDGSLRPNVIVTSDRDGILQARGSKYCPAAVNTSITGENKGTKLAAVGLSCHFHGLSNTETEHFEGHPDILLRVGLICDRTLTFRAIEHLIEKAGLSSDEVTGFEFRSKRWRGWPGDVRICTQTQDVHNVSKRHRILCKDTFTPARCRLCFDKSNIFSDITIGDAWGLREDREGASVILVRTQRGLDAVLSAQKARVITTDAIDSEAIFKGQAIERRRRDWTAYIAAWKKMGHPAPDFTIEDRWQADISNMSLRPYHRQLKWATYLAGLDSPKQCLKAAKRHLFLLQLRRFLSPKKMVRRLFNLVRI